MVCSGPLVALGQPTKQRLGHDVMSPEISMGCVRSKLSGFISFSLSWLPRRRSLRNVFDVINIDDCGGELRPATLKITASHIVLQQNDGRGVEWPIQCLKRYGFSGGVFSFELGRRSPTGAGIYAFKCKNAEQLILTLQMCLERSLSDEGQKCGTGSTMALRGSDVTSYLRPTPHLSTVSCSDLRTDADDDGVEGSGTVQRFPVPAQRRSRSCHSYLNVVPSSVDYLYANIVHADRFVTPDALLSYAVLDMNADSSDCVRTGLSAPTSPGYTMIDFEKTTALSLMVGRSMRHGTAPAFSQCTTTS